MIDSGLLFSGIWFMFRFLPVFLLIYVITPPRYRSISLFFGSLVYYAALEPHFVWVLLLWTLINALLAAPKSRWRMVILVSLDAALLLAAKIYAVKNADTPLPIGISFYLFKMISFQADLYSGKLEQKPSFFRTAGYFVMFPQLLEGPIAGFGELYPGDGIPANGRKGYLQQAETGLQLLMAGVCMKVLLADRFALLWAEITRIGYESISTPLAWMGAYGYSFQLYYDFWGYSLMAAGLGMMLGFPFIRNFHHPYASRSVTEFYRRWHITLGRFFRDYVYIPLGGSKEGSQKTVRNLLVVWLLTGLWHGQSLNFLIWAGVLLLLILWEKFAVADFLKKLPVLGRLHVWILIPVTWVIFAIRDTGQLGRYLSRLLPFFGASPHVNPEDWIKLGSSCVETFVLGILLLLPQIGNFFVKHRNSLFWKTMLLLLFWVALYRIVISSSNPFMYLQF